MKIFVLKSKIHRAVVTEVELDYEGSLGVDIELMNLAGISPFERIEVYNIDNGERFSTYIIELPQKSRRIALYGAAAKKGKIGDRLIITTYTISEEDEGISPKVVILDSSNNPIEVKS